MVPDLVKERSDTANTHNSYSFHKHRVHLQLLGLCASFGFLNKALHCRRRAHLHSQVKKRQSISFIGFIRKSCT